MSTTPLTLVAQQIGSRTRPCQDVKTDITQGKGRPSGSHPCDNNTAAEAPFDPEAILATMLSLLSSVDSASSVLYPYSLDVSASPTECSPIGDGHRTTSETSARVPKLKKKWSQVGYHPLSVLQPLCHFDLDSNPFATQTFQIHKSRSTSTPVSPRAEPIASTSKDALNTVAVDKLLELLIVIISKAPADILPVTNTSHNHADSTACDDSLLSPTGATAPVSTPIMDLILKAVIAWIRLSAVSKREWSSPSTERSDLAWQLSDPEQPILPNEDDILEARQKVIERLAYMASPQLSSAIAMTAGASTSRTLLAFGTISPDTSSDIGHCCTGAGASTPFQSQIHGPTWKNPTSSTSAHGTTPSLSLPPWRKKSAATPSRPIESMLTSTATVERKMSKPIKLPSRPTPRARKRQNHHLFALSKILEEKPAVGASILSQGGVPLAVSAVIRMPDVTTDFEEAQAAYPPHDGEDRLFQESADPGMDTAELPQEKPQVLSTMVGSSSTSMAAVDSTIKGSKHWSTPFNFEALATHTSTTANTTTLFQEIAEPSTTDINKAEKTWNSSQLMPKTNSLQSIDCLWAKKGRRISEKPRLVLKQQLIHSIKTTGSTSLKSENKSAANSQPAEYW
ncbi:hypothetical protein BGX31_006779 [Mortierella sp. GBA43]|nr:hypothetical protein BGX31_006779 [Mortierella sp. GBA43]